MDTAITVIPPTAIANRPKRRKLTLQDAQAVAALVIDEKQTEREACLNLNINPEQWTVWKCRHKQSAMFEALCTRMRGAEIGHSMRQIKNCGDGVGMKQPDWRAHAFRLSALAPERFGAQAGAGQAQPGANSMTDECMLKLLAMLRSNEKQAQVIDVQTVPQIEDKTVQNVVVKS